MEAFTLAGSTRLSHCTRTGPPRSRCPQGEVQETQTFFYFYTCVLYITPHLLPTLMNVQYCVDTGESPVSPAGPRFWFGHLCDGAYMFTAYFMAIHISMCHTSLHHALCCETHGPGPIPVRTDTMQGCWKKVLNLNLCVCATTLLLIFLL
jgi:hypothetical protein